MSNEEWGWTFAPRAQASFEKLESYEQDRITSKLNEIVTDEWRDPDEYVEPLAGVPHDKLRIGVFRLGCRVDHEQAHLAIYEIEKRSGAYSDDD